MGDSKRGPFAERTPDRFLLTDWAAFGALSAELGRLALDKVRAFYRPNEPKIEALDIRPKRVIYVNRPPLIGNGVHAGQMAINGLEGPHQEPVVVRASN